MVLNLIDPRTFAIFKQHIFSIIFILYLLNIINCSKEEKSLNIENDSSPKHIIHSNSTFTVFLNELDLEKFNSTTNCYFLQFFAPWCGHCKNLKPVYESAAKIAHEKGLECKFAAIDATQNERLSKEWETKSYPTIYFINNQLGKKINYNGQRTEDDFLNFIIYYSKEFRIINKIISTESESTNLLLEIDTTQKSNYLLIFANNDIHKSKIDQLRNISDFMIGYFNTIYILDTKQGNKEVTNYLFDKVIDSSPPTIKDNNLFNAENFYVFSRLYKNNPKFFEEFELLSFTELEWADINLLKNAFNIFRFPLFNTSTEEIINFGLGTGFNSIVIFHNEYELKDKQIDERNLTENEQKLNYKEELDIERLKNEKKIIFFFNLYQSSLSHKHLVKQFLIFINVFKLVKLWFEKIRTLEGVKDGDYRCFGQYFQKKILLQILGIKEMCLQLN